jgi:hypothetical protein
MDYSLNRLLTLTDITSSAGQTPAQTPNLQLAKTSASNIQSVTVYNNNCLTILNCNNDEDSYLDAGVSGLNAIIPTPGNGTTNAGDTPQEVVMIVSDGVIDEDSGGRKMAPINTLVQNCQALKNRNVRIAFLYLTYNPLPTNPFYVSNIAPFQPQIATAAQNCASGGLYFQVNTDGDVSGALTTLFQKAIATAHLSQ